MYIDRGGNFNLPTKKLTLLVSSIKILISRQDRRIENSDGLLIFLQGGGECWNVNNCKGRCKPDSTNPQHCTALIDEVI